MSLKDDVHGIMDWFVTEWKNIKGSGAGAELSADEQDLAAKLRTQLVDVAHNVEADAKDDANTVATDAQHAAGDVAGATEGQTTQEAAAPTAGEQEAANSTSGPVIPTQQPGAPA